MKQEYDAAFGRPNPKPPLAEPPSDVATPVDVARAIAYAQGWAHEVATRTDREGRERALGYLNDWLSIAASRLGKEAVDATARGQAFLFVGVDGSRYSFRPLPRTR